jgi:hypothetical protein
LGFLRGRLGMRRIDRLSACGGKEQQNGCAEKQSFFHISTSDPVTDPLFIHIHSILEYRRGFCKQKRRFLHKSV